MKVDLMKFDKRNVLVIVVLVAIISFALGVTLSNESPYNGAFLIYNESSGEWDPSGTGSTGLLIDGNTLCFPGTTPCDMNIDWNGTDFIING